MKSLVKWLLETFIGVSFIITILLISHLTINSNNETNYGEIYRRNWESKFIIDIEIKQTSCAENYETVVLGKWSGFNEACYCINKIDKTGKLFDKSCVEQDFKSDLYNCQEIERIDEIPIKKYKGSYVCVLRHNISFFDLHRKTNEYLNEKGLNQEFAEGSEDANSTQIKRHEALTNNFPDFISSKGSNMRPIIDIKMLNTSTFFEEDVKKEYNLESYTSINLTSDYKLYIKRMNPKDISSVFDYNRLITNIFTYNEIICSYTDLAPSSAVFDKDKVELGNKHCNNMYKYKNYFYNDNGRRSKSIHFPFDYTLSKADFYDYNNITNFYLNKSIALKHQNEIVPGILSPSLVYENYIFGLGCKHIQDLNKYINTLKAEEFLLYFSFALIGVKCLIATCITLIFLTIAIEQFKKYLPFMYGVTLFFILTNCGLSFLYAIYSKSCHDTIISVENDCQYDYTQQGPFTDKTNPLERQLTSYLRSQNSDAFYLVLAYIVLTFLFSLRFLYFLSLEKNVNVSQDESLIITNPKAVEMTTY